MAESKYRWRNRELREHVEVIDGKRSPTILLKNAVYLHGILKQWITGNIWIYKDRIVYAGEKQPEYIDPDCEIVDCSGFYLVPGYIEPHAHPYHLYSPTSFAYYASKHGTTVLINDNLPLILNFDKKKAFSMLDSLKALPASLYWWARYDGQSEFQNKETIFTNSDVKSWIKHDSVVQGGELTGWPALLDGDDLKLYWIQETKRRNKKVEGHLPGASEKTLAKLKLLGVDADHEAMTGEEILARLMQGYMVTLRYSSIRPDLPDILDQLKELNVMAYDHFMLTTDGSPPGFYEEGVIDVLIKIAIEKGVPPVDAYLMATYVPAKHYSLQHLHGLIATGRVADINFLVSKENPKPVSVLAKGRWIKKEHEEFPETFHLPPGDLGFEPLTINWDLTEDDLQFSMPFGVSLVNSVITKPYSISVDSDRQSLDPDSNENFLLLVNRRGTRRVSTVLKGFANIGGLASSFTYSGDILLIGKDKQDLITAFKRLKEINGGIVVVENGKIIYELPLPYLGMMSGEPFEQLIKEEKEFRGLMRERGYSFEDPVYTLLFFTSTHLPYIRVTSVGVFDVMQKRVLFPSIMR